MSIWMQISIAIFWASLRNNSTGCAGISPVLAKMLGWSMGKHVMRLWRSTFSQSKLLALTCGLEQRPLDGLNALWHGLDADGVVPSRVQVIQAEVWVRNVDVAAVSVEPVSVESLQVVVGNLEQRTKNSLLHVSMKREKMLSSITWQMGFLPGTSFPFGWSVEGMCPLSTELLDYKHNHVDISTQIPT